MTAYDDLCKLVDRMEGVMTNALLGNRYVPDSAPGASEVFRALQAVAGEIGDLEGQRDKLQALLIECRANLRADQDEISKLGRQAAAHMEVCRQDTAELEQRLADAEVRAAGALMQYALIDQVTKDHQIWLNRWYDVSDVNEQVWFIGDDGREYDVASTVTEFVVRDKPKQPTVRERLLEVLYVRSASDRSAELTADDLLAAFPQLKDGGT